MWARGYIPRLPSAALPWQDTTDARAGLAAGTALRVLSRDPADGAMTCLWRIPPGWSQPTPFALAADEELFLLEGSLDEDTQHLRRGSYRFRPRGHRHPPLASREGALLLAMWSAVPRHHDCDSIAHGGSLEVPWLDTRAMPERPTPVEGTVPGIQVRILRQDASSGGMTLIVAIPPGWKSRARNTTTASRRASSSRGRSGSAKTGIPTPWPPATISSVRRGSSTGRCARQSAPRH